MRVQPVVMPNAGSAPYATRPRRGDNVVRVVYGRCLLFLLPLSIFYMSVVDAAAKGELDTINTLAPAYLVSVLLWTSYSTIRREPALIWTGVAWFPIASAIFYGFGSLVEVLGNETTKQALSAHPLFIQSEQLLASNQLSAFGITFVILGIWSHSVCYGSVWRSLGRNAQSQPALLRRETLAGILLVIGGLLKYGLLKPAQWGMIDILIPGSLGELGSLVDIGFAILAYAAIKNRGVVGAVFLATFPIHLFLTVLSFAKVEILLAMLLPTVGAYVAHRSIAILGLCLLLMTAAFVYSQDLVHFGRHAIALETGNIDQAGYGKRTAIVAAYALTENVEIFEIEERQGWWTRLNFAGVQAYAIEARNMGIPAFDMSNAWMYFIPRAIWPEKPIMHSPSREFYVLVTGNAPTSFLALSIYGDLFWHYGWIGVVLGCGAIGWLYAMMAWRALHVVLQHDYIMIPVVLMALEMSIRGPNQFVLSGTVGPIPIYIAFSVALIVLKNLLARRRVK